MNDPIERLRGLIREWLPPFVEANPGTDVGDYQEVPKGAPPLLPAEAAGFLEAMDSGVVEMVSDERGRQVGLARLPGYRAYYCYSVIGRPSGSLPHIQLYRELLTHLAVAARLHLDYGYPKHSLSMDEDSFDVVVYGSHNEPFIAVEVKKQVSELDKTVNRLVELSRERFEPVCGERLSNADKKYRGLLALRPPLFWAVCPGREAAFDVTYSHDPAGALLRERSEIPRYSG